MRSSREREEFETTHAFWMLLAARAAVKEEAEIARLTVADIPSLVPAKLCGIGLLPETAKTWTLALQVDGEESSSVTESFLPGLDALFEEAIRHGGALNARLEQLPSDFPLAGLLERWGIQFMVIVPLLTLDTQVGMLLVGRGSAEGFARKEVFLLQTLAEHLAITIEKQRLHQRQQQYAMDLEALVGERNDQLDLSEEKHRALLEINNAIVVNLDRESLFKAVTRALRKIVNFDRSSLTLLDAESDLLQVYALTDVSPGKELLPVGTEFPRKGSHLESVFEHNRPLIGRDLMREPRGSVADELLKGGIRSYLTVPLTIKGKTIGTLNVGSRAPDQYSNDNAEFLLEVGTQVALAVENMLAYEEISQLKVRLEQENVYLQEEIKTEHGFEEIIGRSPAIKKVLKSAETVAPTDATVLLTGETGTGKELVARAIHNLSPRQSRTLVKVNCAALPAGLIESELFGHERGAFTGAIARKIGRFQLADGGTIFLDEVGDLPLELQARLLRVLQEGEFERVGGSQTLKVDARVIAATNGDLSKAVDEGSFRSDLYYRLNVFPIQIPPLRERREDIPVLVRHFQMKYGLKLGKRVKTTSQATLNALVAHLWPGNVRELENVIERGMILSGGDRLELGNWPPKTGDGPGAGPVPTLAELEREHIESVLTLTGWRVSGDKGAARLLGLKPTTLQARMKKLGIARKI